MAKVLWFTGLSGSGKTTIVDSVVEILKQSIKNDGRASFAVSGGRTPIPLLDALSDLKLDWSSVDLTLVDDRWVEPSHEDSNEMLVRARLIKNKAKKINFIPLKNNNKTAKDGHKLSEELLQKVKSPFDVVVLGVGSDGHTASLFPCSDELTEGMNLNNPCRLIATSPKTAPYERMSLTAKAIIDSKNVFLHLNGSDKLHTLELAMTNKDAMKMPIYFFLEKGLKIYWSP